MGRARTGITTKEARRIELSYLLKNQFIKKGQIISFKLSWTDGNSILVKSVYNDQEQYLELSYTLTDRLRSKQYSCSYTVDISLVKSNLGVGLVPYFVCPESGRKCRVLYMAYGSHVWKSRDAYRNRIYYESQVSSQYSKYNDQYWRLVNEIERLTSKKRWQTHYAGKKTQRYKRYLKLKAKRDKADSLRFHPDNMPKIIRDTFTSF